MASRYRVALAARYAKVPYFRGSVAINCNCEVRHAASILAQPESSLPGDRTVSATSGGQTAGSLLANIVAAGLGQTQARTSCWSCPKGARRYRLKRLLRELWG
jgi:hypothetical protein